MALKNLFGKKGSSSPCGSACGAPEKPAEPKPEEPKPSACGSACGAPDKK